MLSSVSKSKECCGESGGRFFKLKVGGESRVLPSPLGVALRLLRVEHLRDPADALGPAVAEEQPLAHLEDQVKFKDHHGTKMDERSMGLQGGPTGRQQTFGDITSRMHRTNYGSVPSAFFQFQSSLSMAVMCALS